MFYEQTGMKNDAMMNLIKQGKSQISICGTTLHRRTLRALILNLVVPSESWDGNLF